MPSGENKFYVNNEYTCERFSDFIGEELVEVTRKMFHLSDKKEDTYIAGLSMGGYGAIVNGFKFNNTFGYVAGLSSALILDDVLSELDDIRQTKLLNLIQGKVQTGGLFPGRSACRRI